MTDRPILFSAPMVRAILDGTKTQTRRVLKDHPGDAWVHDGFGRITSKHPKQGRFGLFVRRGIGTDFPECDIVPCPYGQPGDRLWVREAWRHTASSLEEARAITEDIASGTAVDYRATYLERCMRELGFSEADAKMADRFERWRPSIHMPRWASRITLEITRVRVERLQDISRTDAMAEGIRPFGDSNGWHVEHGIHYMGDPEDSYFSLWEAINGPGSVESNPWVWVVEFKRVAP